MVGLPFPRRLALATGLLTMLAARGANAQAVDFRGLVGGFGGAFAGAVLADQQRQQLERMERIEQLRLQQLQYQNRLRNSQVPPGSPGNAPFPAPDPASQQEAALHEPVPFKVDDYVLGQVGSQQNLLRGFDCHASESFSGFRWCKQFKVNDRIPVYTSLLISDNGALTYYNKFYGKTHFLRGAVQSQIDEVSRQHHEAARKLLMPGNTDGLGGVIASWGALQLVPVGSAVANDLAAGKSISTGIMVDFLGNPGESAKRGWPVFRIQGGSGYFWVARYDQKGDGILRFGICNASAIDMLKQAPSPVPAPQQLPAVAQQPVTPPPVAAPKSGPPVPSQPATPAVVPRPDDSPTLVAGGIGDQASFDVKKDGSAQPYASSVKVEWSFSRAQSVR